MENGKQPITPTMYTKFGDGSDDYMPLKDGQKTGWEIKFGGLTKREYFAGLAMNEFIAYSLKYGQAHISFEACAADAVKMADALLKELDKPKNEAQ